MTARKRLLQNRAARWVVTVGGLAIIASILGIMVFISVEVVPLLGGAEVEVKSQVELARGYDGGGIITDEYRERALILAPDLSLTVLNLVDGTSEREAMPAPVAAEPSGDQAETTENPDSEGAPTEQSESEAESTGEAEVSPYSWIATSTDRQAIAATNGVEVIVLPVDFPATFNEGVRTIGVQLAPPYRIELQPTIATPTAFDAEVNEDGDAVVAVAFDDGTLQVVEVAVEASFLSSDLTVSSQVRSATGLAGLEHLVVGTGQDVLFAADGNNLYLWELGEDLSNAVSIAAGEQSITAIESLLGSRSVVVAHEDGSLDVWSRLTTGLHRIRELPSTLNPVVELRSSPRDKGFVALEDSGALVLIHATSERVLWRGYLAEQSADAARQLPIDLFYAPKADGIIALMSNQTVMLEVDNPHPEVSLKTLFGKIWYEGYDSPEYVWQSTGGTDDFEPKLSLVPLLIGTLKGTFYSMLLAVPLAVLAAMYASQFMHPRLLATIKPAIEVMAALPSVVLGFLAGLWLAPRLEQVLPGLILALVVMPPATLLAGWLWTRLPASWRKAQTDGAEVLWFAVFLVITAAACFQLNSVIESSVFAPDFQSWVGTALGLTYDQRNAVVVGLAMGFAVIPIIFAISEDAFSNVPKNLTSGSLALGASRWQTVTRVVLPTASPGIFSAIMIGFGRAIGETMIVLMATGNTPIMDWNPFNGFRTLSANIAVEIPEAPQYGTLYRVLFLSGLVLFILTFLVNTVAEVVRQRLRRKYSEL